MSTEAEGIGREYHPAGALRLLDIVNGQEIPANDQADRPRTPRGSVPNDAASADEPVIMEDDEVQVVQQVVGNAGIVVVDVEVEHPDDDDGEPIGLAALEQMGISDGEEQGAGADADAAVADVDEADAEAAQYLAEVEADNDRAVAAVDADEQYRAELETGAGAEPEVPEVAEPRDDEGTDSMPELESMEEG